MADEQIIEPVAEPEVNRSQERITQLSEKVRIEAEGRQAAEEKAAAAEKRAAFADSFADIVSTHPAAKDFKAEIETKVLAGYSAEDAALSTLAKAGKLGTQAPVQQAEVAGGSAPNVISNTGTKPVSEMSQAERRAQLEKDIVWN